MTYEEKQEELNAEYDRALARARAHIANGTDYTSEEWEAEKERARIAGSNENVNSAHRTFLPLSLEQVKANDEAEAYLKHQGRSLALLDFVMFGRRP